MKIAVIGLGKLGLPTACVFATTNLVVGCQHKVVGIDTNKHFVDEINAGRCPVDEPGLEPLLEKARANTTFSTRFEDIGDDCEIYFLVVPTPSDKDDTFANDFVIDALEKLAPLLVEQQGRGFYPIVVCVSTVMPGTCKEVFIPFLEEATEGVCGVDFGFCYNPEFIALGSVVADFKNPDMVLIGESDERAGEKVAAVYEQVLDCDRRRHDCLLARLRVERKSCGCGKHEGNPWARIQRMSLISAEITKLSLNCSLTWKISIGNFLGLLCEQFPGADVDKVTDAIGMDSRIGPKLLKPGMGFGGPCLLPQTPVLAEKDFIPRQYPIEDVQVGDRVYTHKGRWQRVTEVYRRNYEGPLVRLGGHGDSIGITPEHPVYCASIEQGDLSAPLWRNAGALRAGATLAVAVPFACIPYEEVCHQFFLPHYDEEHFKGVVYNLEVEEDESYTAGPFFVHNCLPRDVRALKTIVPEEYHGFAVPQEVNKWMRNLIVGTVRDRLGPVAMGDTGPKVAILGMGYKPGTWVYEDSESFRVADELMLTHGYDITWSDPLVPQDAYADAPKHTSAARACVDADAILVLTHDPLWVKLPWDIIVGLANEPCVIIDVWRILTDVEWPEKVLYWGLGKNLDREG